MVSLDADVKARFLAALAHELTIAGRDSYVENGEGLLRPELLRSINEIQHRVLACLSQLLSSQGDSSFEQSIASWVLSSTSNDVRNWGVTAWNSAKGRL